MSAEVLPLAITMMAGPQIVSALILVTGETPVKASLAYIAGIAGAATLGILAARALAGLLGEGLSLGDDSGPSTAALVIQVALVALLIALALRTYLRRDSAEPPKWLGRLQGAGPADAFRFGALLILLLPGDIVVMLTTGVNLKANDLPFSAALPLIGLVALIATVPLLGYLLLGSRGKSLMGRMRDWMNANSWVVNIAVYLIFVALIAT
jgi:hypothetical protein